MNFKIVERPTLLVRYHFSVADYVFTLLCFPVYSAKIIFLTFFVVPDNILATMDLGSTGESGFICCWMPL